MEVLSGTLAGSVDQEDLVVGLLGQLVRPESSNAANHELPELVLERQLHDSSVLFGLDLVHFSSFRRTSHYTACIYCELEGLDVIIVESQTRRSVVKNRTEFKL